MRRITGAVGARLRAMTDSDSGMVAIWTALLMVVLLGMAAISVDIARWYVEAQRLQKTVDAAAMAGVPYLPEHLPAAESSANAVIKANGWDPSKVSVVKAQEGGKTRYRVTMSSKVNNNFGSVLGLPVTTITRTAVADYRAPAPLGSPCNVHGNEPPQSGKVVGSQLPADCTEKPNFWAAASGPETFKAQGDQFDTRKCSPEASESGCNPDKSNVDYDARGNVIIIRVREPLNRPLKVQLFDPAYVDTDTECYSLPDVPQNTLGTNPVDNAIERYGRQKATYCAGDDDAFTYKYPVLNGGSGNLFDTEQPTVTSFGLLKPSVSRNPYSKDANAPSNQLKAVQYPGFAMDNVGEPWKKAEPSAVLPAGDTAIAQLSQDNDLTKVFHRWVDFYTINNPQVGDYYLRIRTNVAWGNPSRVFAEGDDAAALGNGNNRFAVRAFTDSPDDNKKVQVTPYQRMTLYANSGTSEQNLNLIRVLPSSAGQNIVFSFFDLGEVTGDTGATMTVKPPAKSNGTANSLGKCILSGKINDPQTECTISKIDRAGWDGQAQTVTVPVPPDYSCKVDDPLGCWWKIELDYAGKAVTDQFTWTAVLDGDPVRLVE